MSPYVFRLLNQFFAFAWLLIVGSNGAQYYSQDAPYEAAVILAGAGYFVLVFRRQLQHLVCFKEYLLVCSLLVAPLLLMLLSDTVFDRAAYTSQFSILLVFVVASVLALQADLDGTLTVTAFTLVALGAALNVYELFIENNLWSNAPGRSAGFYVNPNISGEALLGYGLFFLLARVGKLRIADLVLMALVVVGEFTTFSRAGILASLVFLVAAALLRVQRRDMPRLVAGGAFITLLVFAFASVVLTNVDLSEDAEKRLDSLLGAGGVGDYEKDRGDAASDALEVIKQYPVFGAGVSTVNDMEEGPHNMFLAMMVDYGSAGLMAYLLVISTLILSVRGVGRELAASVWLYVGWLVVFSFASHNLLAEAPTIPLLGFALARAYRIQSLRKERQVEPLIYQETIPCGF